VTSQRFREQIVSIRRPRLTDRLAARLADALAHSRLRRSVRSARRALRRPRWGNLRRNRPLSEQYGSDRGTPVDRIYIESFLSEHRDVIRGRVLEVKDSGYTQRFGGEAVVDAQVLDITPTNRRATIIADLGAPGSLPQAKFDCCILTQTLQCVHDPAWGLRNAWDALKPGGSLLITIPVAAKVEPAYDDFWRWTPKGFHQLLQTCLPDADATIESRGNFLALIAYLYGMAAEDLETDELLREDPEYPVIVTAHLRKP